MVISAIFDDQIFDSAYFEKRCFYIRKIFFLLVNSSINLENPYNLRMFFLWEGRLFCAP